MAAPWNGKFAGLRQMASHRHGIGKRAGAAALVLLFLGLSVPSPAEALPPKVSFPELLENKERYQNKTVRIRGFIHVGFENHTIWASKEDVDFLNADFREVIWLDLSPAQYEKFRGRFNKRYGLVTGRFTSTGCNGHLCIFGGVLHDVEFISH